jgi:hypothetical protein
MQLGPLLAKRLDLAYEMRLKGYEPITPHLVGPAGIGKSMFLTQWAVRKAKQLGLEFVDADRINPEDVEQYLEEADKYFVFKDCRLTGLDPVDLSGQPRPVNSKYVAFLPACNCEASKRVRRRPIHRRALQRKPAKHARSGLQGCTRLQDRRRGAQPESVRCCSFKHCPVQQPRNKPS